MVLLQGSYFSDISSFSGKTPTKQGDNVTDFSSKHEATSGHLRNDGNEDNYAVKWEGFFVPKRRVAINSGQNPMI